MGATRYASVLGLGFGDCGKGLFVDALTRRWGAHTVVRFSGGAQAGHNVVAPSEGGAVRRHHTFSQFGAGTLVPGTRTVLLDPMIVHPTALLVEAEALGRIGIHDALARLTIDARCRITTPFHQAAGRLRELARGDEAHGTCGVGVGETVRHALEHPDQAMRYAELAPAIPHQARREKLHSIRETLLAELSTLFPNDDDERASAEFRVLRDETLAERWLGIARALARQCIPSSAESNSTELRRPGCVLFEGAQGVLLDEGFGFHPHTTWSSITTIAVESAASRAGITSPIEHYGVLRTYLTRHGLGPLPTHDPSLDGQLTEPHNHSEGWQGHFRRGHPDAVLLRYAIESAGKLTGLLISHLDVFDRGVHLKWCQRYTLPPQPGEARVIEELPRAPAGDLSHQSKLTRLLSSAHPEYAPEPITSEQGYLQRVASVTDLPVLLRSHGNTSAGVRDTSENSL